jgi:hypothetical protein
LRGADPLRAGRGRKPHTEPDAVSGMALTGYGLFSARRFSGDRKAARPAGDQSRPLPGAKVNPFLANRPERPATSRPPGRKPLARSLVLARCGGGPRLGPPRPRGMQRDGTDPPRRMRENLFWTLEGTAGHFAVSAARRYGSG